MKKGLVFGKFLPLHTGHLALIRFAQQHCDQLTLLVCYTDKEPIAGNIRTQWVQTAVQDYPAIQVLGFAYDDAVLPNTSVSSLEVSRAWAAAFKETVPDTDIIFTSEPYGDYVAAFMQIQHMPFDLPRAMIPVAASSILRQPFRYWDFIAAPAKAWFVKKIVLLGSESTGKSTLTQLLAGRYRTSFVPEMARDIVEHTESCTADDLFAIATLHAQKIIISVPSAHQLLFIDTDLSITQSYSRFLFQQELTVEPWIESANKADLYFFLETDCPYVQDGTRLNETEREQLSISHKTILQEKGIRYYTVTGNWAERLKYMQSIIDQLYFID